MTNEDKANEICELAEYTHDKVQCDIAFRAAIDMAEWKDQQFKEYLEKKLADIDDRVCFSSGRIMYDEDKVAVVCIIREIINELFKAY